MLSSGSVTPLVNRLQATSKKDNIKNTSTPQCESWNDSFSKLINITGKENINKNYVTRLNTLLNGRDSFVKPFTCNNKKTFYDDIFNYLSEFANNRNDKDVKKKEISGLLDELLKMTDTNDIDSEMFLHKVTLIIDAYLKNNLKRAFDPNDIKKINTIRETLIFLIEKPSKYVIQDKWEFKLGNNQIMFESVTKTGSEDLDDPFHQYFKNILAYMTTKNQDGVRVLGERPKSPCSKKQVSNNFYISSQEGRAGGKGESENEKQVMALKKEIEDLKQQLEGNVCLEERINEKQKTIEEQNEIIKKMKAEAEEKTRIEEEAKAKAEAERKRGDEEIEKIRRYKEIISKQNETDSKIERIQRELEEKKRELEEYKKKKINAEAEAKAKVDFDVWYNEEFKHELAGLVPVPGIQVTKDETYYDSCTDL